MKSYRQFVTESFETSDGYKLDPRTKGEILSVGFAIVPPKTLIKGYGTNYCYNIDRKDGWFRKVEGSGKDYGLMLRSAKLSSKKMPIQWGDGNVTLYPVNVKYMPGEYDYDDSSMYVNGQMTLYINRAVDSRLTPETVIKYVNQNGKTWIP